MSRTTTQIIEKIPERKMWLDPDASLIGGANALAPDTEPGDAPEVEEAIAAAEREQRVLRRNHEIVRGLLPRADRIVIEYHVRFAKEQNGNDQIKDEWFVHAYFGDSLITRVGGTAYLAAMDVVRLIESFGSKARDAAGERGI